MRTRLFIPALACAALASAISSPAARAQDERGAVVRVIDLNYVFANCEELKAMRLALQDDANTLGEELKAGEGELKDLEDEARGYKRGSKEYKDLMADYLKRRSDLDVRSRMGQSEFAEREAKDVYLIYEKILQILDEYCADRGIDVVLNCNSAKPDTTQAASIHGRVGRNVVYWREDIDITNEIIHRLNGTSPKPPKARVGREKGGKGVPRKQ